MQIFNGYNTELKSVFLYYNFYYYFYAQKWVLNANILIVRWIAHATRDVGLDSHLTLIIP